MRQKISSHIVNCHSFRFRNKNYSLKKLRINFTIDCRVSKECDVKWKGNVNKNRIVLFRKGTPKHPIDEFKRSKLTQSQIGLSFR